MYFATVRAYNTAGTGPSSVPVNVTTRKSRECIKQPMTEKQVTAANIQVTCGQK